MLAVGWKETLPVLQSSRKFELLVRPRRVQESVSGDGGSLPLRL